VAVSDSAILGAAARRPDEDKSQSVVGSFHRKAERCLWALWQRLTRSHRLFTTSHCHPHFIYRFVSVQVSVRSLSSPLSSPLSYLATTARCHGDITRPEPGTGYAPLVNASPFPSTHSFSLKLHFRDSKGQLIKTVEANDGDDILSIAHEHDIDLEGHRFHHFGPFILP
jgi:hypothetical protein